MKRARRKRGSVVFNKTRKTWNFLWCEDGHRYSKVIGTLREHPTKEAAWAKVEMIRDSLRQRRSTAAPPETVRELALQYESEKLPSRRNTARVFRSWLHNHILPYWGDTPIRDVRPREAEVWLNKLKLSPKSRSHVRSILRALVDYAMFCDVLAISRNPIDLVRIRGGVKRMKQPRSLNETEFSVLREHLHQPFRTMACVAVYFGLRVSELLALRWSDVDWLNQTLTIERRIVAQEVDEVKTDGSRRTMPAGRILLEMLKQWRQETHFAGDGDWIFASPFQLGRLPYTDSGFWRELQRAGKEAGVGSLGTHTFRHTYRSWLDAVGTTVAVQQKMMRHADVRTTMNIYGDVVTDEMVVAQRKVVGMALGEPSN